MKEVLTSTPTKSSEISRSTAGGRTFVPIAPAPGYDTEMSDTRVTEKRKRGRPPAKKPSVPEEILQIGHENCNVKKIRPAPPNLSSVILNEAKFGGKCTGNASDKIKINEKVVDNIMKRYVPLKRSISDAENSTTCEDGKRKCQYLLGPRKKIMQKNRKTISAILNANKIAKLGSSNVVDKIYSGALRYNISKLKQPPNQTLRPILPRVDQPVVSISSVGSLQLNNSVVNIPISQESVSESNDSVIIVDSSVLGKKRSRPLSRLGGRFYIKWRDRKALSRSRSLSPKHSELTAVDVDSTLSENPNLADVSSDVECGNDDEETESENESFCPSAQGESNKFLVNQSSQIGDNKNKSVSNILCAASTTETLLAPVNNSHLDIMDQSNNSHATMQKVIISYQAETFSDAAQVLFVPQISVKPGPWVVVKNHFVGVTAFDLCVPKSSTSTSRFQPQQDCGYEGIGTVVAVGSECSRVKVGDCVGYIQAGAFSDFTQVCDNHIIKLPDIKKDYVALLVDGLTAALALDKMACIRENETVLVISAASSMVGQLAVQWAHIHGCHVIGLCYSEEELKSLQTLNSCDRMINVTSEDLDIVLRTEYPEGVDVVLDTQVGVAGGGVFRRCVARIAMGGRVVVTGFSSECELSTADWDGIRTLNLLQTLMSRAAMLGGFVLRRYTEHWSEYLTRLVELRNSGKLKYSMIFFTKSSDSADCGVGNIIGVVDMARTRPSYGKMIVEI